MMTKHDLICASKLMISSFGMSYYAGYAGGSFIFPPLCDKKGRKNFLAACLLIHTISVTVAMALPKGYVKGVIAMMFLIGCCSSLRTSVAMCLMYDSSPKRHHGLMNSIFFVVQIMTLFYSTIHYQFIDSSMYGPQGFGIA